MSLPARLIEGYEAFRSGRLAAEQDRYRDLAEQGQSPEIMVIGCCDSRVSPEVIFDARPGELFVVRNVANLVPPYSPDGTYHGVSAALEFGVGALRVKHIVVLGHARCGGVRAFAEDSAPLSPGDFIGKWMSLIAPAAEKLGPRGDTPPKRREISPTRRAPASGPGDLARYAITSPAPRTPGRREGTFRRVSTDSRARLNNVCQTSAQWPAGGGGRPPPRNAQQAQERGQWPDGPVELDIGGPL